MAEISARITLDSNGFTSGVNSVITQTKYMENSINKARENILQMARLKIETRIHANTTDADRSISKMHENLNSLKKKVSVIIASKDMASESIHRISKNVNDVVKKNYKLEIKAIDKTKNILAEIKNNIFSLKTLAAGIVLGGTAKFAFDNTIGAGARLEQEQVAMKHFIWNNNKSAQAAQIQTMTDDFISQLRKNANETPFGTNEVLSAGRRSINIMNGDIGKSMDLVKLAENMAALNPGKSVMDAMEALADLKTGEFERMKEFGFKFSADQFKALIGKGKNDDLTDSEMTKAYDSLVKQKLNPTFDGGADKLSKTAAGQWSTTTGNIESIFSDLGKTFLPAVNKVLIPINAALDKIGSSKAFANLQKDLMTFADTTANKAVKFLDDLGNNPKKIDEYKKQFKQFLNDIIAGMKIAKEFGSALLEVGKVLEPIIQLVASHPKLFVGLFLGMESFKGIVTMKNAFKYIQTEIPLLLTSLIALKTSTLNILKTFSTGAISVLRPFFAFMLANPVGLAITGIITAVGLLYIAWTHNWCDIQGKTKAFTANIKKEMDMFVKDSKEAWGRFKEFLEHPIIASVKMVNEGPEVPTKREPGGGPQGLAVDRGAGEKSPRGSVGNSPFTEWINKTKKEVPIKLSGIEASINKWFDSLPSKTYNNLLKINSSIHKWAESQHKENIRQFKEWGKYIEKWFEDIGHKIPKKMESWGKGINKWFDNTKNRIPKKMSEWGKGISKWFSDMKTKIPKDMDSWWKGMNKWFDDTKNKIPKKFGELEKGIKKWFSDIGKSAPKEINKGVAAGVAQQKKSFMDNLGKMVVDGMEFMLALTAIAAVAVARELIKRFLNALRTLPVEGKKLGEEFIKCLGDGINSGVDTIEKDFQSFINDLKDFWKDFKEFFEHPIETTVKVFKDVKVGGNGPEGLVKDSGKAKKNALGTSFFSGGLTWINEVGPELIELPTGAKIYDHKKSMEMLKPKSDSMANQFGKTGEDIPEGLAKGIKKTSPKAIDAITETAENIIKTFGSGITENSKYPIKSTNDLTTNINGIFTILAKDSNPLGQNVIAELGQGMLDKQNNLTDITKTLTDKVITTFKQGFGIHSPSKVMYELGSFLLQGLVNGMTSEDMEGFVKDWIGSMTSAAGGAIGGNLSGWISAAIALTGVSPDWFGPLATLIEHESGGDPMSINLWDWNAQQGHPSKGLMQLIDENMQDHHLPGMDNIYDPVSNIAAGIRLIQHDYGNIYNVPGIRALAQGRSYVGYATGTDNATHGMHEVAENGMELVLGRQFRNFKGGEQVLNNKDTMNLFKNFDGLDILKEKISSFKLPKIKDFILPKVEQIDFKPIKLEKVEINKESNINSNDSKKGSEKKFIINMYGTVIREETDIDKIVDKLVRELDKASYNMA